MSDNIVTPEAHIGGTPAGDMIVDLAKRVGVPLRLPLLSTTPLDARQTVLWEIVDELTKGDRHD